MFDVQGTVQKRRGLIEMPYKKEKYYLKYKDMDVLGFNTSSMESWVVNSDFLPIQLQDKPADYQLIKNFCSGRLLMMNRKHCKEILDACGIDDQTDINICLVSRALSFRDNYWICSDDSKETWEKINLYRNVFSAQISKIALTGDMADEDIGGCIGDDIYTGELTNKGTRAKCFFRGKEGIYLAKNESMAEIASEILAFFIASNMNLPCRKYIYKEMYGKDCSVCQVSTSDVYEMIPCRDVMQYYNENQQRYGEGYYKFFMKIDPVNFLKMQKFDYITLNTDRNRDNFGLLMIDHKFDSLYPLFDHDSCFKGKGTGGIYFPTSMTFEKTLDAIKEDYGDIFYNSIYPDVLQLYQVIRSKKFKQFFLEYKTIEEFQKMKERIESVLK